MIQPSYYAERSTLRKVIYAYNGYENIKKSEMLSGEQHDILGIAIPEVGNAPDSTYVQMLFNTLQKYMFAEIGFDTDEMFIERFQARWDEWAEYYHELIAKLYTDSGLFSRIINRNGTTNITETRDISETNTSDETVDDTTTRTISDDVTGTQSGSGNRTEYNVQTQNNTASNNTTSEQDRTENETYSSDKNRTGTNTRDEDNKHDTVTEQNVTETEITAEKFNLFEKMNVIIADFTERFNNLFMQVFTTM